MQRTGGSVMPAPRRFTCVASFVLAYTFVVGVLDAEEPVRPAHKMWLVVLATENANREFTLPKQQNVAAHAKTFFDQLLVSKESGASAERSWLLRDVRDAGARSKAATAAELRNVLREIARKAKHDDVLCLFLSSGASLTSDCRLILEDASESSLPQSTMLTSEIADLCHDIHCRNKLAVIHARVCTREGLPPIRLPILERTAAGIQSEFDRFGLSSIACLEQVKTDSETSSQPTFFETLSSGLSGTAEPDLLKANYWVTAKSLIPALTSRYSSKSGRAESATCAFSADLPNFAFARNQANAKKLDEVLHSLREKLNADKVAASALSDGVRLLKFVPSLSDDLQLREAYLNYNAGKLSTGDLLQLRHRLGQAHRLRGDAASDFVSIIKKVRETVASRFIKSGLGNTSVQAGLIELIDRLGDPVDPELLREIASAPRMTSDEIDELIKHVRMAIGNREDLSLERAVELCVTGMMVVLDSHSGFYSPSRYKELENQFIKAQFPGIGVQLLPDPQTGQTMIFTPVIGGPAFLQGIRGGDRVTAIDGRDVRKTPYDKVSEMLGGEAGTKIHLTIEREGVLRPMQFDVVTKPIKTESVIGYRREPNFEWSYWIEPKSNRVAYICLTEFAKETAEDLKKVLRQLRAGGAAGLVLDLRFNLGGIKQSAVDVADVFLDDVTIVTFRSRNSPPDTRKGTKFGTLRDLPMAVLVNRQSASAAEIVAAALADQQRAVVVGERTFGKGSVQDSIVFQPMRFAIKMTTEFFDRPSGRNLHRFFHSAEEEDWGVRPTPGFEVPLFYEEFQQLRRDLFNVRAITTKPPSAPPANDTQLQRAAGYLLDYTKRTP